MAGPGLQQVSRLFGRDAECAAIDRLLEDARAGAGGAVVIRGEAGIGKSALLEYARQRAAAMAVLSATGVEAESDLAFAGLHELLRPVLDHLGELPDGQSQALAGALGLGPSAGADRFLVCAALLSLLAAAAEVRPVLCLVDDAQWLDKPSAEALVFTARRLRAEPAAILFCAREGDPRRFEAPGVHELVLAELDNGSAAALLARHAQGAAPGVRERLLTDAAGNPLALAELPAALSQAQLAGQDPLPEALPLTARLQAAFAQKAARLPETTQMALVIAAVDDISEAATVVRAVAQPACRLMRSTRPRRQA